MGRMNYGFTDRPNMRPPGAPPLGQDGMPRQPEMGGLAALAPTAVGSRLGRPGALVGAGLSAVRQGPVGPASAGAQSSGQTGMWGMTPEQYQIAVSQQMGRYRAVPNY